METDSNEQLSLERKSLEERKSRFRAKRFDANEEPFANEKQFIKNGDPFRPIEDVIRDVEQSEDLSSDSDRHNTSREDNSETIANTDCDRNAFKRDKDSRGMDLSSETEDNSGLNSDTNESNDTFANNPVSDGKINCNDKTSGPQNESPIDDSLTTEAQLLYSQSVDEIVEEVITKTDATQKSGMN